MGGARTPDDGRYRPLIHACSAVFAVIVVVIVVAVARVSPDLGARLANAGAFVGGVAAAVAVLAAVSVYWLQDRRITGERQRAKLHDLELSWYVGDLNRDRLAAERAIIKYPDASLKELFETLDAEEYDCISQVLRIFYLLDSWKETKYIDEQHAIDVFGRSYHWWYTMLIEPRSRMMARGAEFDRDWRELVVFHDWLAVPRRQS